MFCFSQKLKAFFHYMDSPEGQSLTATWFYLFLFYPALQMFAFILTVISDNATTCHQDPMQVTSASK